MNGIHQTFQMLFGKPSPNTSNCRTIEGKT